jgi:glycosyl transferase family 25
MMAEYKPKYNFKRQHITKGSLGLIQSAFVLMNEFVKSNETHALILEDDVYTMKNLDKKLFINNELLKNKDLVYLGCHTSRHNIYPEKSSVIFIDVLNHEDLIYGTYAMIISKKLAQYVLNIGIDTILQLNLSWDLLLNYIRDTEKQRFTFFLYFKEVFIPNVIKEGGINPIKDLSFYTKNKINLHNYYIPGANTLFSQNQIATIMSGHNENFFFEFVNKIVYINLETREDRKEHIEGQLSKYVHSSKIYRFNAIRNSKGAIGCGLSHIAVLEMAIAENWDNVFIAEDDLTWTEHFTGGYRVLENLIRGDYDVIVLGGSFVKSYKDSFKLISCNCALSYIVHKPYYQKLLDCFKYAVEGLNATGFEPMYAIDQAWKPLQRRDNWYVIKPNMCMQLPSHSDIQNVFKDYRSYFDETTEYDLPAVVQTGVPKITSAVLPSLNTKSFKFIPGSVQKNKKTQYQTADVPKAIKIKNTVFGNRQVEDYNETNTSEQKQFNYNFDNNGVLHRPNIKHLTAYREGEIITENKDIPKPINFKKPSLSFKEFRVYDEDEKNTKNNDIPRSINFINLSLDPKKFSIYRELEINTSNEAESEGIDVTKPVKIKNAMFIPTERPLIESEQPQSNDVLPPIDNYTVKFNIPIIPPVPPAPKLVSFKNLIRGLKTNKV